jgi:hypothetical protein
MDTQGMPAPKTMLIRGLKPGAWLLLVLGLAVAAVARADESSPTFALSGFGTLGVTRTTSDEVHFVRDLAQPEGAGRRWDGRVDSMLGVQGNLKLNSQLEGVVQVVSRYRYDRSFTPEVSWAYLKYEPDPKLSLRAGRLGTEFFMLADSRMVGYSYLSARPPGDYFWSLPFYSIDGADAVLSVPLGDSVLRAKVFYGISDERIALEDREWKLDGSPMTGGYLDLQTGPWVFRVSYANIVFRNNLPLDSVFDKYLPPAMVQQSGDYLATANTRSHYYAFGAVYDSGPWQLHLMLNHIVQGSNAFQSSDGGYFQAGYRIGSVTPFVGHSWVRSDQRGNTLNRVVGAIMVDGHADQNTTTAGARWDVARNVALKAQWDHINGEPESIFPYRRETSAWTGKMDVFTLTMDFVF